MSFATGMDGTVYEGLRGSTPPPTESRLRDAFFTAIAGEGPTEILNQILSSKDAGSYVNSRIQVSYCNQGGATAGWEHIGNKLYNRIAAERTPSGKPYLPIPCATEEGDTSTVYDLSALMVAKLFGNEKLAKALIAKGADPEDTTEIQYTVPGRKEIYSEPWKAERFAAPSRSAAGGTRRRRGAKKPVRRIRRTRRTPHKK